MRPAVAGRIGYLLLETPVAGQAAATHGSELIDALRRQGWTVEVFTSPHGGVARSTSIARRLFGYIATQARLMRRLGALDVIYVRSHFMALPIVLAAGWRRVPVVHEVNGKPTDLVVTYPWLARWEGLLAWLYRAQFRRADHLFAVTDGLATWARGFAGHDRVSVVSNGANGALFTPSGPTLNLASPYVVFVGGLVKWHGIGTMLAAAGMPEWPAGVRLVIVGDGPERAVVAAHASGARARIEALGRIAYGDVPKVLRGAVAALSPIEDPQGRSAAGVAPLKLFEAMGCGVPVIVSDLPFQADLVRATGAGVVFAVGDAPALAAAVRGLVAVPERAHAAGRAGAAYVAGHATWDHRAKDVALILAALRRTERGHVVR